MTRWAITVVTLISAAQVAAGQASPPPFFVEVGGQWSIDRSTHDVTDITLGRMRGTTAPSAMGWTTSLFVGGGSMVGGRIEARYRRRLGAKAGLDLSAGPVRRFVGLGSAARPAYGLTAAAGASDGLLGLTGRVDLVHADRPIVVPSIGAQLRGKAVPLVVGTAAAFLLLMTFGYSGPST